MNNQSSALRIFHDTGSAVDNDLRTVLAAWHEATIQWERTHNALKAQVEQLTRRAHQQDKIERGVKQPGSGALVAARAGQRIHELLVQADAYLSLLRRRLVDDASALALAQNLGASLSTAETLAEDLFELASDHEPKLRPVKLRSLVQEVHANLLPRLSSQQIRTAVDVTDHLVIVADADMLRQAIFRLAVRALDTMPAGGELVVTACESGRGLELEIADSGTGLAEGSRKQTFEPFSTAGKLGSGLELAIVKRLVETHGGSVEATNCPEGGAAFTLFFPRQALQAAA